MNHSITTTVLFICLFLFAVSFIHHYFRNSSIPSVCWVLLAAVGYGFLNHHLHLRLPEVLIEPDIVLFVLLPVLIFDASRKIPIRELKSVIFEVGFLATFGVVGVAFIIGVLFAYFTKIPIIDAIFFGAIMAATDPVAVSAIFKNFTFPEKLNVLVEGESLLNDGTAVILFTVLSAVILEGLPFSLGHSLITFGKSVVGAILVGGIIGTGFSLLIRKWKEVHEQFIGAVLPIVAAYLTFVITEHYLHVSGVISVMAATMAMTYFHSALYHSHKEKGKDSYFNKFWDFLGDLTNKILFFILGASIGVHLYDIPWRFAPLLIIILLLSRTLVVYVAGYLFKVVRIPLHMPWLAVINLAGLKGALSVALILLIPKEYQFRMLFHCSAFVMILFTLIGNSIAMRWYLNRVSLVSLKT